MSERILITYTTWTGTTAEVADFIGKKLAEKGWTSDILPIKEVKDIIPYRAIVLGSPIHASHWMKEALSFLQKNATALRDKKTALFNTCLTMRNPAPENINMTLAYNDEARTLVHPESEASFAGTVRYDRLNFFVKFLMKKIIKAPEGDFRNWQAIESWTNEISEKLK